MTPESKTHTMDRKKLSVGYETSGYGKRTNKTATVYLINGKAYAKDKRGSELHYQTDLPGYVMVNLFKYPGSDPYFISEGLISRHEEYTYSEPVKCGWRNWGAKTKQSTPRALSAG